MRRETLPAATRPGRRLGRVVAAGLVTALLVTSTGCQSMRRRITVRTDPPGALVLVDGEEIGYAPASIDFTHYATREISVVKSGYETDTRLHDFDAPLHQQPGPDFFVDNFSPVPLTDRRDVTIKLRPQGTVDTDDLLRRAGAMRGEAIFGR
ncbi:MAG: PEGA domain-containing protein [Planctomycetota bacterium]